MVVLLDVYIVVPDNQLMWTLAIAINRTTSDLKISVALGPGKSSVHPSPQLCLRHTSW